MSLIGIARLSLPLGALGLSLTGCFDADVSINGNEGVPLSELEMVGAAPTELLLAASDNIVITEGNELTIEVEGSDQATEAVRFVLDGDLLGITRKEEFWGLDQSATIKITMPAPEEITITGSGNIEASTLSEANEISILGSGALRTETASASTIAITLGGSGSAKLGSVKAQKVEINIGGSGSVEMAGTTDELDISLGGSGSARLSDLSADDAEISILGSGGVSLQSDGKVQADIMGSGSVKVAGNAACTQNALGSGSLICTKSVADAEMPDEENAE